MDGKKSSGQEPPPPPDQRGAVIVRSHSRRRIDEVDVYRPQSMPGRIVVMCSHVATDAEIIDACVGLLSDVEMALLFEHLGIEPGTPSNPEEQQP